MAIATGPTSPATAPGRWWLPVVRGRAPNIGAMEHELVVRGEGEVRVMPDRASIRVLVDGEGASRDEAYESAARLARAVDAVLAAEAGSIERVTTAALVVQPRTRWRKGETVRTGWRAYRASVVEIRPWSGWETSWPR